MNTQQVGKVYLVGAGPGDPGLLTLKGLRCLQEADLILYDGLVNPILLRHTGANAERTARAGRGAHRHLDQDEINRRLIAAAKEGKTVVRLKGGDPFVFGRGGEEALTLVQAGIPFRICPGITAGIVERAEDGGVTEITTPMAMGELGLKPGWPSMMRGYLNEEERYKKCFADGWYLSGDLAMRDSDGYFWFVGRADDVIKSAGHLIGPFEVESALMEHPAVAEVGVIGIPDETAGEVVKAFVGLKPKFEPDEALRKELLGHARKRLGPAVAPRDIAFRSNLPKTRSGKIMRRLLKARELGLPEGDLSTLESDEKK